MMAFDFKGVRFKRFVGFCRRVAKIQQTPDLISFVASEIEHVRFCRIITNSDDQFEKRFTAICEANLMDPDDIRGRMQIVASVLKINKQVDYYAILEVPSDADGKAIKQAYRKKALTFHPDKACGDTANGEAFIKLHAAYVHLSDPKVRRIYDQSRNCSGYWVEGNKSSQIPAWSIGFGRFLSWVFVLIGCGIIVVYALRIYQNRTIILFFEQLRLGQLDKPEKIMKKQFDGEQKPKTIKIVANAMMHKKRNSAAETEYETAASLELRVKAKSEKKIDGVVASMARAKSSDFPQKNRTKSDGTVKPADINQTFKNPANSTAKLRQKRNVKAALSTSASNSKKKISRVLKKNEEMTNPNTGAIKNKNEKKDNYFREHKRILAFLEKYTSTYAQKDLNRFRTFFVQDALEQGKPFEDLLPTYQQTFKTVEALRYHIDLQSFTIDSSAKKILIEGVYTASYRLPEKDWGNSSGTIRMELLDSSGRLMVSRLEYEKGIR